MKKINANSKLVPYVLDRLLYEEKVIKVKISKMYREKYDIPNEINRNSFIYIEKRKSIDVAA